MSKSRILPDIQISVAKSKRETSAFTDTESMRSKSKILLQLPREKSSLDVNSLGLSRQSIHFNRDTESAISDITNNILRLSSSIETSFFSMKGSSAFNSIKHTNKTNDDDLEENLVEDSSENKKDWRKSKYYRLDMEIPNELIFKVNIVFFIYAKYNKVYILHIFV